MGKNTPVIFIMFSVVILALSIVGISVYYGESDWTWIAQQMAGYSLIIMVFGIAVYTLREWIR